MPVVGHTRKLGPEEVLAAWASETMLGFIGRGSVLCGGILSFFCFFVVTGDVDDFLDALGVNRTTGPWTIGVDLDLDRVIAGQINGLYRPSRLFTPAEWRSLLLNFRRLRSLTRA